MDDSRVREENTHSRGKTKIMMCFFRGVRRRGSPVRMKISHFVHENAEITAAKHPKRGWQMNGAPIAGKRYHFRGQGVIGCR